MAVEVGIAVLAAERADDARLDALDALAGAIDGMLEDFAAYRQADIRLHVGLAEATDSPRLVTQMTETQAAMSGLISLIAHPPEVLHVSNMSHRRLLAARARPRRRRGRAGDGRARPRDRARAGGAAAAGLRPGLITSAGAHRRGRSDRGGRYPARELPSAVLT